MYQFSCMCRRLCLHFRFNTESEFLWYLGGGQTNFEKKISWDTQRNHLPCLCLSKSISWDVRHNHFLCLYICLRKNISWDVQRNHLPLLYLWKIYPEMHTVTICFVCKSVFAELQKRANRANLLVLILPSRCLFFGRARVKLCHSVHLLISKIDFI